ncbi:GGDEF domain-containing protein [Methylophaga sp.]|uniref:GGDEF domain-containing protein n=1 Tax=Methylophaga sp. TaxID=2024840 RepID=UPI0027268790|nr:GGDEF domain-containing protein [Methylophaga sp.]MDO8826546.1 GGDEF domain-containing protein [Methylophaga sp.]
MIHSLPSDTTNLRRLEQNTVSVIQAGPVSAERDDALAKLPLILQTSLDTRQLLRLFDEQIKPLLAHSGLQFTHPDNKFEFRMGNNRHHKCNYQLEIDHEYLGQLTFSRAYRFSESEIRLLEDLLCKLVYPLRNSLQYARAIDAALTDSLTQLPNRQAYNNTIEREIDLAHRLRLPLSLLIIDIDYFKNINDSFGHQVGDETLCRVADTLLTSLRRSDALFRIGGEEFAIVLSHSHHEAALLAAERLRNAIYELNQNNSNQKFPITISIGLAELCVGESADSLFSKADEALYQAKFAGRNQVVTSRVNI